MNWMVPVSGQLMLVAVPTPLFVKLTLPTTSGSLLPEKTGATSRCFRLTTCVTDSRPKLGATLFKAFQADTLMTVAGDTGVTATPERCGVLIALKAKLFGATITLPLPVIVRPLSLPLVEA